MWLLALAGIALGVELCGEPPRERGPSVHLLTVGPGDRVDRAFGHTGLYVQDPTADIDAVYAFGAYRFIGWPSIRDFLLGEQRYWMHVRTLEEELEHFRKEGRRIDAQVLDLPDSAAHQLVATLAWLDDDSRRFYDYHWYEANCTTKVRDLIDQMLGGQLRDSLSAPSGTTQRFEVLRHIHPIPWAWYGLSYGASANTDRELTRYEASFLPETLAAELAGVQLESGPLVRQRCRIQESDLPDPLDAPPNRDPILWLVGLALAAAILRGPRPIAAATLALYGVLAATAGTASATLWYVSRIEAYWANSHLLLASPAHLLVLLCALWLWRGDPRSRWLAGAFLVTGLCGVAVGLAGPKPTLGWAGLFLPPLLATILRSPPPDSPLGASTPQG